MAARPLFIDGDPVAWLEQRACAPPSLIPTWPGGDRLVVVVTETIDTRDGRPAIASVLVLASRVDLAASAARCDRAQKRLYFHVPRAALP